MRIIIETPKGSRNKYSFDESSHFFFLKKTLPAGMIFPFDFGFIPGTHGGDGDPLDILVLNETETFTGCMIDCRIIGCLCALQSTGKKKEQNNRFIGVCKQSDLYSRCMSLKNIPRKLLNQIEDFFTHYQHLEGKQFTITQRLGAAKAKELIRANLSHTGFSKP